MTGNRRRALDRRLASLEQLLDKVERGVDRIELVTTVREPGTSLSADAYEGLRKQVIAATGERHAHLTQLARFDAALQAGTTPAELTTLVREWMTQASVTLVTDPQQRDAFEIVGDGRDGDALAVVRPAYVDSLTGRVISRGVAERVATAGSATSRPTADVAPASPLDTSEPTVAQDGGQP
jgi:hypothetical protein